jgi:YVTN family beta-propeller protein
MRLKVIAVLMLMLLLIIPIATASKVFVTSTDSDSVSIYDTVTQEIVAADLEGGPGRVVLNPAGNKAIIALTKSNSISILNLENLEEEARINVGRKPTNLALYQNKVYVTNSNGDEVVEVDLVNKNTIRNIKVGSNPVGIVKSGNKLFVTSKDAGSISVINLDSWRVQETLKGVFHKPGPIASTPDGTRVYFVDTFKNQLRELDSTTLALKEESSQVARVTEEHELVVGNKFALLSADIGIGGEIQVINLDDKSSLSISLSEKPAGLDLENGVIYVATGNLLTMINKETNIQKEFDLGTRVNYVKVLDESYVPIGDIEVTEEDIELPEAEQPAFPWKRLIILLIILAVLALYARHQTKKELLEGEKEEEVTSQDNNVVEIELKEEPVKKEAAPQLVPKEVEIKLEEPENIRSAKKTTKKKTTKKKTTKKTSSKKSKPNKEDKPSEDKVTQGE